MSHDVSHRLLLMEQIDNNLWFSPSADGCIAERGDRDSIDLYYKSIIISEKTLQIYENLSSLRQTLV